MFIHSIVVASTATTLAAATNQRRPSLTCDLWKFGAKHAVFIERSGQYYFL